LIICNTNKEAIILKQEKNRANHICSSSNLSIVIIVLQSSKSSLALAVY